MSYLSLAIGLYGLLCFGVGLWFGWRQALEVARKVVFTRGLTPCSVCGEPSGYFCCGAPWCLQHFEPHVETPT